MSDASQKAETHFAADALAPYLESGELPGAISWLYDNGVEKNRCNDYANVETKRKI